MKIEINYSKGWPSDLEKLTIGGLYEILQEHRGSFIDHYYKHVNTDFLSHVYFRLIDNNFIFSYVLDNKGMRMFCVYEDSSIQFTSKDFLPIFGVLQTFVREYKISTILD